MDYRITPRGVAAGFGALAIVSMGVLSSYSMHRPVAESPYNRTGAPVLQSGPVTTSTTPSTSDNDNGNHVPPPPGAAPPGAPPGGHPGGPGGPPN